LVTTEKLIELILRDSGETTSSRLVTEGLFADFQRLVSRFTAYTRLHRTLLPPALAHFSEPDEEPVVGKLASHVSILDKLGLWVAVKSVVYPF